PGRRGRPEAPPPWPARPPEALAHSTAERTSPLLALDDPPPCAVRMLQTAAEKKAAPVAWL
ncbi:MAG: SPOR domain-containing protein, partial [Elusimicrobiota bacterium]